MYEIANLKILVLENEYKLLNSTFCFFVPVPEVNN